MKTSATGKTTKFNQIYTAMVTDMSESFQFKLILNFDKRLISKGLLLCDLRQSQKKELQPKLKTDFV